MKPASGGEKIFFSAAGEKNAGLFFVSLRVPAQYYVHQVIQKKDCIDHIIKHYCRDTFFTKQSQVDRQTNKHGISNKKISTENAAPFFFVLKT